MPQTQRRRRDPEARRREIVAAAAELIVEIGVDALTHRKVATRAGVPLGATTQYFATLDELREAALRALADEIDARVVETRRAVEAEGATPQVLARLIHEGLEDVRAVQADRAVVTAAVHDPPVRELARRWTREVIGFLSPVHGEDAATAAAVFIDGVLWHAQIHDRPLDQDLVRDALAGIIGALAEAPRSAPDAGDAALDPADAAAGAEVGTADGAGALAEGATAPGTEPRPPASAPPARRSRRPAHDH